MLRELRLRVRALLKRRQLDRDLQDELAWHMEQRRAGSPRAGFGNETLIREELRDMWSFKVIEDVWRDVRHATRVLRRSPGNTLAIVLLLAVGIGANAAIFSLTYPILMERLPVEDPDRLVSFYRSSAQFGSAVAGWSGPAFDAFQQRYHSAEVAVRGGAPAAASTDDRFEGLDTALVTGNYFQVLRLRPASGRLLMPQDDTFEDPAAVFVLSYAGWKGRLGGDPSAIGRQFTLFGRTFTLVGVTPAKFRGTSVDIWIPYNWQPVVGDRDVRRDLGRNWLEMTGRLQPGISREQAQAEAQVVWNQLGREYRMSPDVSLELRPADRAFDNLRERFETPLRVLAGGVAMLLLIACANVASLLLARAGSRQREIAVRQAIGCGRARLIRQFLVESLVLAASGGLLGLMLAGAGARALLALAVPEAVVQAVNPGLNSTVVWFTLAVSAASAVLFGLAPAWRASRVSIESALKSATRSAAGSRSRHLLNRACLVAQTALSVVLVAGAALFGESLFRLYSLDPGFERKQVITASVNSRALRYVGNPDPQYAALADRIVERLSAVPGVISASVTGTGFLTGSQRATGLIVEGHENDPQREPIRINDATWNFLETLGVPLVAGRSFSARDNAGAPLAAVVNQSFVRRYFPNESAIGKRLWPSRGDSGPIEIVGVAKDSKYNNFREESVPLVYLPEAQDPRNFNYVQLRAQGSLQALIPLVRQAILEVDERLSPSRVETLEEALDRTLARDILLARLSGLFGALALLVACFGVYGMISYMVSLRTPEIGVRLAIGAQPGNVLAEVVRDALKTVAPGVAIGLAGALAAERVIASMLFRSKPHDPVLYGIVALGLLATAAVAAYGPARRAARIDPVGALRCE